MPTRKKILDLRQSFAEGAVDKAKNRHNVGSNIFSPRDSESQTFHYSVFELELALIDRLRQKIEEPCLVSDNGEIL